MTSTERWDNHTIIGYVALDIDGNPYQPELRERSYPRKKPTTVYKTIGLALKYSPIKCAAEVRMYTPDRNF